MKKVPILFSAFLITITVACVAAEIPKITDIIQKEGKFVFTDSSSTYQFYKNGVFILEPTGFSGRTIQGVWKTEDSNLFVVTGKWGWMNGISKTNDFRQLILSITLHPEQTKGDERLGAMKRFKIYPVYFTIEKLIEISKDQYEKEIKAEPVAQADRKG